MKINNETFLKGLLAFNSLFLQVKAIEALKLRELKSFAIFLNDKGLSPDDPLDQIYQIVLILLTRKMTEKKYINFYERYLD